MSDNAMIELPYVGAHAADAYVDKANALVAAAAVPWRTSFGEPRVTIRYKGERNECK